MASEPGMTAEQLATVQRVTRLVADLEREAIAPNVSKIDFNKWRSRLRTKAIVDEYERVYKAIKPPAPSAYVAQAMAELKASADAMMKEAEKIKAEAETRLKELEEYRASVVDERRNIVNMTVHQLLEMHPTWQKELQQRVDNNVTLDPDTLPATEEDVPEVLRRHVRENNAAKAEYEASLKKAETASKAP
jgi:hypothetical protein